MSETCQACNSKNTLAGRISTGDGLDFTWEEKPPDVVIAEGINLGPPRDRRRSGRSDNEREWFKHSTPSRRAVSDDYRFSIGITNSVACKACGHISLFAPRLFKFDEQIDEAIRHHKRKVADIAKVEKAKQKKKSKITDLDKKIRDLEEEKEKLR
jgi:hypothetical protein